MTRTPGVCGVEHVAVCKAVQTRYARRWLGHMLPRNLVVPLRRLRLAILRHSDTPQGLILSKLHMPSILNPNRDAGPAAQIVMHDAGCLYIDNIRSPWENQSAWVSCFEQCLESFVMSLKSSVTCSATPKSSHRSCTDYRISLSIAYPCHPDQPPLQTLPR